LEIFIASTFLYIRGLAIEKMMGILYCHALEICLERESFGAMSWGR
jgi:hypothetical protein